MKDYSNVKSPVLDNFLLSGNRIFQEQLNQEGKDIKVYDFDNNVNEIKCLLIEHTNPLNESEDDLKLCFPSDIDVKRGYVIEKINGDKFLAVTRVKDTPIYKTCKLDYCNYALKWIDNNGDIIEMPSIVTNKTLYTSGVRDYEYSKEGNMVEHILVPFNSHTKELDRDKRLIINNHVWKITKTDWDVKGLVDIMCEEDKFNPTTDNLELGIADYYDNLHIYKLQILNKIPLLSTLNAPTMLEVQVFDNDELVENPILEFTSSNETICTVEDGTITPLQIGDCNITVKFKDIIETISIEVVAQETNNYTIEIQGSESISWADWDYYKAIFKLNSVEYTPSSITFTVTDELGNSTSLAYVDDIQDNECTVYANEDSDSGYVSLNVEDDLGNKTCKKIRIKSMYIP